MTRAILTPATHIQPAALASAVDKVGDDLPCAGTVLVGWLAS